MLSLTFRNPDGGESTIPEVPSEARPSDGIISTKRGNAAGWRKMTGAGKTPVGRWTLSLPKEAAAYFDSGAIDDILFIVTCGGRTPPWPA